MHRRDEGMWARVPVAIVGGIITVIATRSALKWGNIAGGVVFLVLAVATLYLSFFHRKAGDVLIDTEGEMRKVVWPTRDEVTGSTIVVIASTVLLGLAIFLMDVVLTYGLQLVRLY